MKQLGWLKILLGGLLLLSACASPAPAATVAPTASPAPAATQILPLVVTDTAAPPTQPPLPSDTPAPTATAAPSQTPAPTADPLNTACDHPYWPLRQGGVWRIDAKTRVYTETVTAVTGDLTRAEATLLDTYTNGTTQQVLIECDPDGLAYGDAAFTFADGHISSKTVVSATGHFLPAADQLLPGAKWSWRVTADYSIPNYDSKGVFTKQSEYRDVTSQDCTLTKTDTLSLTVGTFPAMFVDCKGTDVSNQNGASATRPFDAQPVYALGVGPNGNSIVSYSVP